MGGRAQGVGEYVGAVVVWGPGVVWGCRVGA